MFDPTAFDNMKVVIEGAIYDLDLDGEISIIDRNDLLILQNCHAVSMLVLNCLVIKQEE